MEGRTVKWKGGGGLAHLGKRQTKATHLTREAGIDHLGAHADDEAPDQAGIDDEVELNGL
jgi:hypothetical protein